MKLFQIFHEVGLPKGVLNLVHGLGSKAGEALVQHSDVIVISFTGSTLIGKHIAKVAAPMMKRLSLELGGKNAALVFADANLDQAVKTLIRGAFLNQGEICLCTSRIYVQDSVFDTFLERKQAWWDLLISFYSTSFQNSFSFTTLFRIYVKCDVKRIPCILHKDNFDIS